MTETFENTTDAAVALISGKVLTDSIGRKYRYLGAKFQQKVGPVHWQGVDEIGTAPWKIVNEIPIFQPAPPPSPPNLPPLIDHGGSRSINVCSEFLDLAKKDIQHEHSLACVKFPSWPVDVFYAYAILAEEVGEVAEALLEYGNDMEPEHLNQAIREAAQVGAMATRLLQHLYVLKLPENPVSKSLLEC